MGKGKQTDAENADRARYHRLPQTNKLQLYRITCEKDNAGQQRVFRYVLQ